MLVLDDDVGADDVGGHQVGRELDAAERAVERLGQRAHQRGLAQAGHAFEQRVAAGEQRDQHLAHQRPLADDHFADFVLDRLAATRNRSGVRLSNGASTLVVFRVIFSPLVRIFSIGLTFSLNHHLWIHDE